ncbi:MAG: sugar phosphate isomerase/epimerase family protein [Candidatus Binatia bacterium]
MARLCFNTFNRSAYFGVEPDLPRQIAAAADAGFPLFGPDLFSLDAWTASGHDLADLVALLKARGLACWELAAGLNVGSEAETLRMARHAADLAAILRPTWILTNVGVPVDASSLALFADACEILASAGTRAAIEYMPLTPANSIAEARKLVDHVGRDRAGILLDTWHHFRGPDTFAALDALPLEYVAYVQFDDALPVSGTDTMWETLERRAFPGEGEFDLEGYCARMRAKGFDGVVSVEILNGEWRQRDEFEFARRAYRTSDRYWCTGG